MLGVFNGLDLRVSAKGKIIIRDILKVTPSYTKMDFLSLEDSS